MSNLFLFRGFGMFLLEELTKRRIFKTLTIYVVVAWAIAQILVEIVDRLSAPAWVGSAVIIIFIAGFPLATIFAWMYDIDAGKIHRVATIKKGMMAWVMAAATMASAGAAIIFYVQSELSESSPDFSTVVTSKFGASRPKPLTTMEGYEFSPALSPDGGYVTFMSQSIGSSSANIYVAEAGGANVMQLTDSENYDKSPAWSPDGTRVAFIRVFVDNENSRHDIIWKPVLGGPETRLVTVNKMVFNLDWSTDGEFIAYETEIDSGRGGHIVLLSTKTGEQRDFTEQQIDISDRHPKFSPDGRSLALIRARMPTGKFGVCIRDLESAEETCVAPNGEEGFINHFAWMPDSRGFIVSVGGVPGTRLLMWMSSTTGEASVLPFGDDAEYLSISRKGGQLAYDTYFQDHNIWRIPGPTATGATEPENLISSTLDELDPSYSPDGTRIAFMSARSGDWEIWVANADGSDPHQITQWGFANGPKWSPDSRKISFASDRYPAINPNPEAPAYDSNPTQIFAIDASGGIPQRLTKGEKRAYMASWSADGQWLYFSRESSERDDECQSDSWKMRVDTSEEMLLAECAYGPIEGRDGRVYFLGEEFRIYSVSPDGLDRRTEFGQDHTCSCTFGKCKFYPRGWTIWQTSLVYFDCQDKKIKSVDLVSRESRILQDTGDNVFFPLDPSLDVSPNGQWIIHHRLDRAGSDIMLVEPSQ